MIIAIFVLTFLESVGATLIQRGVYFYTHENLGFSQIQNLWIAFGFGVAYIAGAFLSHGAAVRWGERRVLITCLLGLFATHTALALYRTPTLLVGLVLASATLQGSKWPVVESYVSAGRSPKQLLPLLGRYNVTWAAAGFVAVGLTGLIVGTSLRSLLFWVPALFNLVCVVFTLRLSARPSHLDHAHPDRPAAAELHEMRALLGSARWSMTGSYALLYVVAPLMPTLLAGLALPVTLATPVASVLDGVRVVAFGVFGALSGWHGKRLPLWLTMVTLPVAFLLIVLGSSLPLVILGEVLFGCAAGFSYTAALYYALVADNASVDAGGEHESLIGIGLGLGPLSGLAGQLLVGAQLPGQTSGLGPLVALTITTAPVMALCIACSARALFRPRGRPA